MGILFGLSPPFFVIHSTEDCCSLQGRVGGRLYDPFPTWIDEHERLANTNLGQTSRLSLPVQVVGPVKMF